MDIISAPMLAMNTKQQKGCRLVQPINRPTHKKGSHGREIDDMKKGRMVMNFKPNQVIIEEAFTIDSERRIAF